MAVSYLCGFEMGHGAENALVVGSPSFQTTIVRSGAYAMRCNPTATTAYVQISRRAAGGGTNPSIFQSTRFALRVASLPSATQNILICGSFTLRLLSTGELVVRSGGVDHATSANQLSADGQWHLIEHDVGWSSGSGSRVRVDGVEWASSTTTAAAVTNVVTIGCASSATSDLYFDDIVCEDASLAVSWADWRVLLLPPISDNNRGNWTGGAGGTTNLWQALDNQPPVGAAAGSDTNTSQIQNAISATYPATAAQRGDFNCRDYATAGIGASDTIRAVQAICNHGEGIATGTKPGGLFIVSNPAQTSPGNDFDYGDDIGAAGTFPTNWKAAVGPVSESPSVTLAISPVVGVFKNVGSTREAHVDFAGVYVAYSPAGAAAQDTPELYGRPYGQHGQSQMTQLLAQ